MIDRTTKMLLAAIAFGLLANAAAMVSPVSAQDGVGVHLIQISSDLRRISTGLCRNEKICG